MLAAGIVHYGTGPRTPVWCHIDLGKDIQGQMGYHKPEDFGYPIDLGISYKVAFCTCKPRMDSRAWEASHVGY